MVEYGTSPHIIRPKNKEALAFPSSGGARSVRKGKIRTNVKYGGKTINTNAVFAKVVHHPGTTAKPFFRPAYEILKMKLIKAKLATPTSK